MLGLLRSAMSRFDDSLEIAGAVAGVLAGLDVAAEVLDVELYVSTLPCFFAPLGGGVLV
ncbi:hypothetical protein RFH54_14185 [Acinetobacter soli]|nr:hypothetical protein [Acinetobacter soli]MDQ8997082.1 hypothetical protein [Acinetobacter soli]